MKLNGRWRKMRNAPQMNVLLAGNPNVGKSTLFNALTGMDQHTGNWPGKTVSVADGVFFGERCVCKITDLPGTYSLSAHSAEEEVARDSICFGTYDAIAVVCDATSLERTLGLALQITGITDKVIVCVNLMDEAKRKGITVDIPELEARLGIPVCGISARKRKTVKDFSRRLESLLLGEERCRATNAEYPDEIEYEIREISDIIGETDGSISQRWAAMSLLEGDDEMTEKIISHLEAEFSDDSPLYSQVHTSALKLRHAGFDGEKIADAYASAIVTGAEKLCAGVVRSESDSRRTDNMIDKVLTGKVFGYPVMLLLLALCFFITVKGADYPSELLSGLLFSLIPRLNTVFHAIGAPEFARGLIVDGGYTTLAFVVSVMLPPMAIFFPLFTFLEDIGYLPRVAYNLDKPFSRCSACGKQSLTMCMGLGCTAAGVCGCRIIDSKRERLIAILTTSFVPCNGKLPTFVSLIALFIVGGGVGAAVGSAAVLTCIMVFGILMTFAASKLLSVTFLRGSPSSFTLELPPYRPPKIRDIIVRSLIDRTLKLLLRAASVAFPCGLFIWLLANTHVDGVSLIAYASGALEPIGRALGLDGAILCAFILGLPANEIVLPIVLMIYTASGTVAIDANLSEVLLMNGWTWATALSFIIFSLLHWPCSTALWQIKKETGSLPLTLLAAALPTLFGVVACLLLNLII